MQKEVLTVRILPTIKTKLINEADKGNTTISRLASKILNDYYEQNKNIKSNKQVREVTKPSSMQGGTPKRRFK